MAELSGFSAAQSLANIGPQSLRLPTTMDEVCDCQSNCGASRILRGLAQIVVSGLTDLIEINVQAVPAPDRVQVVVIPWKKDGVAKNGVAPPGGWIAVDGSEVVGLGNGEYAERWSNNMPLEWDGQVAAELLDTGQVKLTFPQPTSANRPFTYTVKDGEEATVPTVGDPQLDATRVILTADTALTNPGDSETLIVHVATQYDGVEADSAPVTITVPEPEPDTPAPPEPGGE